MANIKFGVIFPQNEIGSDPFGIRDYAQAAEELGYAHLLVYDHVLGAGVANRPDWTGPYTSDTPFHEIFVLLGYLAGLTRTLELVTGVLVLPMRQTALAAKQASAVDVLSGGRLRLGVGVGWNTVEYEAMNEEFHTRGARIAEQVEVMRALWTQKVVSFHGKWHHIDEAGLEPMPVQRPIPVWMGGYADATLKRIAQTADGWIAFLKPEDRARGLLDTLHKYIEEAGRAPQDVGLEVSLSIAQGTDSELAQWAETWKTLGATHIGINTMRGGLDSPQKHIDAIRRLKDVLGVGQQG